MNWGNMRSVTALFLLLVVSAVTAFCAPITLELLGGSLIKGDLVSWNGQQAVVKAEFGSLTFKREQAAFDARQNWRDQLILPSPLLY